VCVNAECLGGIRTARYVVLSDRIRNSQVLKRQQTIKTTANNGMQVKEIEAPIEVSTAGTASKKEFP